MSPILKRDVSEQIRHARRLASVMSGFGSSSSSSKSPYSNAEYPDSVPAYVSSSSSRQGLEELDRPDAYDPVVSDKHLGGREPIRNTDDGRALKEKWKADPDNVQNAKHERDVDEEHWDAVDEGGHEELTDPSESQQMLQSPFQQRGVEPMGFQDSDDSAYGTVKWHSLGKGRVKDLRNLLLESTPSLLLSLVGLVFTGELLEHVARWKVFRRVDELFILVPMIGNLKGNLEMCLSARLGTSANIGELDERQTRKTLLKANMTLLCLQALLISSLAAFLSFLLGLITTHRLGDKANAGGVFGDDAGLGVADGEWHEGYTRPGWKQLVMVIATGMGSTGVTAAVLGGFMSSLVVVSRWMGLDPDNLTPPLAACLGDLMTLFILAMIGTVLVGTMDTPIPLIAVIIMSIIVCVFARRVLRNEWISKVARGGWVPLIVAMLIASGTGMLLDIGVGQFRGFALLSISMGGLTGSIGAIHANRLSTHLHTQLHSRSASQHNTQTLSAQQGMMTLFLIAFPCQLSFLLFVNWANWIDLSLGWAGWACFAGTTAISLGMAHQLTLLFWSRNLDPDSYTLPIHSALVDFAGSILLLLAYKICAWQGIDVAPRPPGITPT